MRELREEFSIEAVVERYMMRGRAVYPELIVELHADTVPYVAGESSSRTTMRSYTWPLEELTASEMPEADVPIVEWLVTAGMQAQDGWTVQP